MVRTKDKYFPKNYTEYKRLQIKRAKEKWGASGFWRSHIKQFYKIIDDTLDVTGDITKICCMGIRVGNEYKAFKMIKRINARIYGVDICSDVEKVGSYCFAYDFTDLPNDWTNGFKLVYSNSLDHAYDVRKTMKEWYRVSNKYVLITLYEAKTLSRADLYSFTEDSVDEIVDKTLFKILKNWRVEGQHNSFNLLLEKIHG